MIKTSNPDKAAENLGFLLKSGLLDNIERANKIQKFLDSRAPGTGPALPAISAVTNGPPDDEAIDAGSLPSASRVRNSAQSVGQVRIIGKDSFQYSCTAFLIGKDLALTAARCLQRGAIADFLIGSDSFRLDMPPAVIVTGTEENYAIVRLTGTPGIQYGVLKLSDKPPAVGDSLSIGLIIGLRITADQQRPEETGGRRCETIQTGEDDNSREKMQNVRGDSSASWLASFLGAPGPGAKCFCEKSG